MMAVGKKQKTNSKQDQNEEEWEEQVQKFLSVSEEQWWKKGIFVHLTASNLKLPFTSVAVGALET